MSAELAQQSDSTELLATVRRERAEASARAAERARFKHVLAIRLHTTTTFTAECSCRLWAIEHKQTSHPIDADAARLLVLEQHHEHRRQMDVSYTHEDTPGRCKTFNALDNETGRIRFAGVYCGNRARRTRCQFCKHGWSSAQCDYPTGGACKKCRGRKTDGDGYNCHSCAGTGRRMCNKHLCVDCRAHLEPDEDYCPDHRVRAGLPPLRKAESCVWTTKPQIINRKCLHAGCAVQIGYGERVLYFIMRARAMCGACGEQYKQLFT